MAVVYQVARYGNGFKGPGRRWLQLAIGTLRRRLRTIEGPYTIDDPDDPKDGETKRDRKQTLDRVHDRMSSGQVGLKLIVKGKNYDEAAFAIRKADLTGPHPLIDHGVKYLHMRYLFATIPPNTADCSGFTLKVVADYNKTELPHSAAMQADDKHIRTFYDPADLQPDDFIFYVYGRLGQTIDHVAIYAEPGKELGARPSAGGVEFTPIDWDNVVKFGRLVPNRGE